MKFYFNCKLSLKILRGMILKCQKKNIIKSCFEFLVVESVQPEFTVNCVSVLLILIGQCGDARAFLSRAALPSETTSYLLPNYQP